MLTDKEKAAVLDRIITIARHRRGTTESEGRGWSSDKATERDLETFDEIMGVLNEDGIDLL